MHITRVSEAHSLLRWIHAHFILLDIFSYTVLIILFAESINSWGAKNWKLLASQQYFDKHGAFISLFVSMPLVLFCSYIVLKNLYHASLLLVKVKRQQLKSPKSQFNESHKIDE